MVFPFFVSTKKNMLICVIYIFWRCLCFVYINPFRTSLSSYLPHMFRYLKIPNNVYILLEVIIFCLQHL